MARSIKFSDDTFLDASGVVLEQKTINSFLGAQIGLPTTSNIVEFTKNVCRYLHDNGYKVYVGEFINPGVDAFAVIYISGSGILFNTNNNYLFRYISDTTQIVESIDISNP